MWYYDSINLQHTTSGNNIVIRVTDKKHNDTVASVILYQNRLPIVQKTPASAFIAMDSVYIDTLVAFDPDGDRLSSVKAPAPRRSRWAGRESFIGYLRSSIPVATPLPFEYGTGINRYFARTRCMCTAIKAIQRP